ncbi:RNA polymerase sigma factor [Pseudonocardia sp. H11422]|uniref:RNA polymerase sigma factor n=1 Tax=Pseudonocardia sp. H11422 TaxID=2835866 RepID=UPI001BDBF41B|nr:RNA polymerase sigma factor [Pseudonocardia sp. H11422]
MLRVARQYVMRQVTAEDVVQDTWVAVLRNVDRFEGRSTFTTWLLRILVNTARTRRNRERRTVPWPATPADAELWDVALRTDPAGTADPERRALSGEAWGVIDRALQALPGRQRTVVVLREVHGWSAEEVRAALGVSAGNQRVLLHRGRERLRDLLASHVHPGPAHLAAGT